MTPLTVVKKISVPFNIKVWNSYKMLNDTMTSLKLCFWMVLLAPFALWGQQDLNLLSRLDRSIDESSGLIVLEGRIITHNDSGGEAALYELNESTGNVSRRVVISNSSNRDWEDIDLDEEYIYIGDFGNNNGTRRDLRIYRIAIADYLDSDDAASAVAIEFSYEDQTDFTSSPMSTNFDAEGLIAYGDFLYIFTKNWIDNRTNIYKLPKTPGRHSALRVDAIDSGGLVTGATYNSLSERIVLVGYDGFSPFLFEISNFSPDEFSSGTLKRSKLDVPPGSSFQVESIAFADSGRHLLTSEGNVLGYAALMETFLSTLSTGAVDLKDSILFPNPAGENLWIDVQPGVNRIEIYDYSGKLILDKKVEYASISLDELPEGHYLVRLYNDSGVTVRKLIRE